VVDDVVEDRDPLAAKEFFQLCGRPAPIRREGAAVHVEAGDLLSQLLRHHVDGGGGPAFQDVCQRVQPAWCE
jgi:hypothetical protein